MKKLIAIGLLLISLNLSGCVGWGPQGCEQFHGPIRAVGNGVLDAGCASCGTHSDCGDHCNNCDGYNGPFGTVRKTLACGSGCGEIYYGDWVSNPPNTCNECDATGYSRGVNGRIPWLSNPFAFWGYQYRPNGGGYGNPLRGAVWGYGRYGAHWDGVGCGGVGCNSGCSDCGRHAQVYEGEIAPIPAQQPEVMKKQVNRPSAQSRPSRTRQVSYDAPQAPPAPRRNSLR
ncbi:hypothetical protein OAE37_00915 [Pirellulaceae bacterium]|nr:hypothetical protein [Pirellulaceae bacterium]